MPRPLKYDWSDKRDICYKLWVEEHQTPKQIIAYFANALGVDESELPKVPVDEASFTRQFKRWRFPEIHHRLTLEDKAVLAERVRELWQASVRAREIRKILNEEGWEIDDRQLATLRAKHGFRLRTDAGLPKGPQPQKRKRWIDIVPPAATGVPDGDVMDEEPAQTEQSPSLLSDEAAQRAQRLAQIQAESDEHLLNGKRRRRIRGYSHLPADAPGLPPRYVSETSLDECKAFLQLGNDEYKVMREQYAAICTETGIIKKTQCQTGVWQASKDRLVRENKHLSAVMNPLQPDLDKKISALDVICSDVTKRLRISVNRISIGEASNGLGLNPIQSKDMRRLFVETLTEDCFQSRLICGDEHWEELMQQWYTKDAGLQQLVAKGDAQTMTFLLILAKDAMKRYMGDKVHKDPSLKQHADHNYGPGPGPARATVDRRQRYTEKLALRKLSAPAAPTPQPSAPPGTSLPQGAQYHQEPSMLELDPALLANVTPSESEQTTRPTLAAARHLSDVAPTQAAAGPSASIPAYFRLSPQSHLVSHHPRLWLSKLASPTIIDLHKAATVRAGPARVSQIHGIVKTENGPEAGEDSYQIDSQDELVAYLEEAQGKATFVVLLEGGYS